MLFFNSAAEIFTVNDAEAGTAIPRNMDCPNIIDRRNRTFTARDELWLVWIVHPDELNPAAPWEALTKRCEGFFAHFSHAFTSLLLPHLNAELP